jgi:hypothetical protein
MSIAEQILEERKQAAEEEENLTKSSREKYVQLYYQAHIRAILDPSEENKNAMMEARADAGISDEQLVAESTAIQKYFDLFDITQNLEKSVAEYGAANENLKTTEKRHEAEIKAARQAIMTAQNYRADVGKARITLYEIAERFPHFFETVDLGRGYPDVYLRGSQEAVNARKQAEAMKKPVEASVPVETSAPVEQTSEATSNPADRFSASTPDCEVLVKDGVRILDPLKNVPQFGLPSAEDLALEVEQSPADSPNDAEEDFTLEELQEEAKSAGRPPIPDHILDRVKKMRGRK